jgi:hypothetical protein
MSTPLDSLLVGPSQKPGLCFPVGTLRNPTTVNVSRWAAAMSVVCRVLFFIAGGMQLGVELPGQQCPGEILDSLLKSHLKSTLPEGTWFVMNVEGRSADGIDIGRAIFHWNGQRIDEMYDKQSGKFYIFDDKGVAKESFEI